MELSNCIGIVYFFKKEIIFIFVVYGDIGDIIFNNKFNLLKKWKSINK